MNEVAIEVENGDVRVCLANDQYERRRYDSESPILHFAQRLGRQLLLPPRKPGFELLELVRAQFGFTQAGFASLVDGSAHAGYVDSSTPGQFVVRKEQIVPRVAITWVDLERLVIILNRGNRVAAFVMRAADSLDRVRLVSGRQLRVREQTLEHGNCKVLILCGLLLIAAAANVWLEVPNR